MASTDSMVTNQAIWNSMNAFARLSMTGFCLCLAACRIEISVPTSGSVTSTSGAFECASGAVCTVDVVDVHFEETFTAAPADGFEFSGWKVRDRGLCGGSLQPCSLHTREFAGNDTLMGFLEDPTETFYLSPTFRSTGFEALLIGHSFFRPFAEGLPEHAERAGIENHNGAVVFAGGPNGAPEALWDNATKRAQIQAVLDQGDVELFVMTYHPDYPGLRGYRLWIDYALSRNPQTQFAVAIPWTPYPESFDTDTYSSEWHEFHEGEFHSGVDALRRLYPDNTFFCIPYGQSAIELRRKFDAGELAEINVLVGRGGDAIYRDTLGHAEAMLIDLGRLVWLNAIYGVEIDTYEFDAGYSIDLKPLAQKVSEEHDPRYDAPYR